MSIDLSDNLVGYIPAYIAYYSNFGIFPKIAE